MTYRYQLYKCPICGTVTEIVHDGVSAMICCAQFSIFLSSDFWD